MLSQPVFAQTAESTDSTTMAAATLLGEMMRQQVEAMKTNGFNINNEEFADVFVKAFLQQPTGISSEVADAYMNRQVRKLQAGKNATPALSVESQQAFLAKAAAEEGATVTPSGLVFQVITEGEGAMPTDDDVVSVTYAGRLSDGTVFDSTETPVQFPVSGLIPGFTEGLKMMKPGGTYRIVIPAALGYGEYGIDIIPGNAALDFVINLEGIVKPEFVEPE